MKKNHYKAITQDGDDCGHKHRSAEKAQECRLKNVGYNHATHMWSAKWHNSYIVEVDAQTAEETYYESCWLQHNYN